VGRPWRERPFAVRVTLAMLYDPLVAAVLALLGALDLRELRGRDGALHALWRRCLPLTAIIGYANTLRRLPARIEPDKRPSSWTSSSARPDACGSRFTVTMPVRHPATQPLTAKRPTHGRQRSSNFDYKVRGAWVARVS
jgi:hypothetical protein